MKLYKKSYRTEKPSLFWDIMTILFLLGVFALIGLSGAIALTYMP